MYLIGWVHGGRQIVWRPRWCRWHCWWSSLLLTQVSCPILSILHLTSSGQCTLAYLLTALPLWLSRCGVVLNGNLLNVKQCVSPEQVVSELWGVTYLMWYILCYLPSDASERAPPNASQTGWCLIYLPLRDGRLSWPRWFRTYRDVLPVSMQSPV